MIITQIESQIRYVTNVDGETTDVLIPVELWEQLMSSINSDNVSGLAIEDVQERVAEHLPEYLEDLQDELKWNKSFNKTQQLIVSTQSAKRDIAEGLAKPMNYENL